MRYRKHGKEGYQLLTTNQVNSMLKTLYEDNNNICFVWVNQIVCKHLNYIQGCQPNNYIKHTLWFNGCKECARVLVKIILTRSRGNHTMIGQEKDFLQLCMLKI